MGSSELGMQRCLTSFSKILFCLVEEIDEQFRLPGIKGCQLLALYVENNHKMSLTLCIKQFGGYA